MPNIRPATLDEIPLLQDLIARSIRTLGANDYTPAQIEGALRGAFGVDTQLIRDQTYFVVEIDGQMAGCGGWSYRQTLFGSDSRKGLTPEEQVQFGTDEHNGDEDQEKTHSTHRARSE